MKETRSSELFSSFEEDEIRTAEILVQLQFMVPASDHGHRFRLIWGCKRRRSAMASPSYSSRLHLAKAKASSPATPLSFSPSESDEKSKRSKRKRHRQEKLENEESLDTIKQLHQQKGDLQKELEKAKCYRDTLKAFHSELKAKQLELSRKRENSNFETNHNLNLSLELVHPTVNNIAAPAYQDRQGQQSLTGDRTAQSYPYPSVPLYPAREFGIVNNGCPVGIPDLNLTAEDSFGFDSAQSLDLQAENKQLNKAMAAQARQNRLQIKRLKTSAAAANRPRFAYR